MKRSGPWLGILLALGLLGWLLFSWLRPVPVPENAANTNSTVSGSSPAGITVIETPSVSPRGPGVSDQLIGEVMLRDYGDPGMPPANDLKLMAGLVRNMALLVKNLYDRPMSGNEDWAAALKGSNPGQTRFLPDHHRVLNDAGQLVDRWGTPLFFHPISRGRFELRSAGPDQKMWTADDIHRNDDGSFRQTPELNPPGLYDPLSPPKGN